MTKIKDRLEGKRVGRESVIMIRFTQAEKEAIAKEAERRGLAVSTMARELIFESPHLRGFPR